MGLEDEIRPIKRGSFFGAASDAASGLRSGLNKLNHFEPFKALPTGVGDLLVGEAPEELDRWAHGFHPFKDRNAPGYSGLRGIPELQESRAGPVADTLFLGADATGAGAGLGMLSKAGLRSAGNNFQRAISDEAMDASRREFVKNAGIVGAGTAAAAAAPDMVRAGLRQLAPNPTTAATRVAKNALTSFPEYTTRIRMLDSLKQPVVYRQRQAALEADDMYQTVAKRRDEAYEKMRDEWYDEQFYLAPEDKYPGEFEDYVETHSGGYLNEDDFLLEQLEAGTEGDALERWNAYRNAEVEALRKANPEWAKKLDDYEELERQWHQARTDLYANREGSVGDLRDELDAIDTIYKKKAKEEFGVLLDDADALEQFKYGDQKYVDPITGLEPAMTFGPDGEEVLEWTRASFMRDRPQTWRYRHWVPNEAVPDSDRLIEEILTNEAFTGPLPSLRTLREPPF